MLATSSDAHSDQPERNTARFNFRTTERIKQTVEHAASLLGQDTSTFAVNAAHQRAIEIINAHEITHLKAEDHQAFFEALHQPAEPTDTLRDAMKQHQNRVARR